MWFYAFLFKVQTDQGLRQCLHTTCARILYSTVQSRYFEVIICSRQLDLFTVFFYSPIVHYDLIVTMYNNNVQQQMHTIKYSYNKVVIRQILQVSFLIGPSLGSE
jgi:hypothetical protein